MFGLRYLPNVVTLKLDAAKCNGCGACVLICPEKVIEIRPNGRYTIAAIEPDGV